MKYHLVPVLTLTALLALTACSSTSNQPPASQASSVAATVEGVPGGIFVTAVEMRATVTAIDRTTRKITLRGTDGKKFSVKAGPDVVNFSQIKVGDEVKAEVTEELVVHVNAKGAATDRGEMAVALAPKGAKPGGVMAETVQITARVQAIDLKKRTATLRFEDGTTKTFPVRPDVELGQHQVGEQVVFRITEMIAISVSKP